MESFIDSQSITTFIIERIVSRRSTKNGTEYFIKWRNYPEDSNTWEPLSKLIEDQASEAIYFFESQMKDTPPQDVASFLSSYKLNPLRLKKKEEPIDSEGDIENQMEEDWMNDFGSLPRDSIKRIVKLQRNHLTQKLFALIEWNSRSLTDYKPPNSFVNTSQLKKYCLKFYLQFLEGMMYTDKQAN